MASIARRYSQALVGLCDKDKSHEPVAADLDKVQAAFVKHPEVLAALENPTVSGNLREKVVARIAKDLSLRPLSSNFVTYLARKERIGELETIIVLFRERLDEIAGRVRAEVTTATALNTLDKTKLQKALEKATGKKVVLEVTVDPDLLGGVVTKVGNIVLDGSVRTQLTKMKEQLLDAVN